MQPAVGNDKSTKFPLICLSTASRPEISLDPHDILSVLSIGFPNLVPVHAARLVGEAVTLAAAEIFRAVRKIKAATST
jgi:hypothetical protein